MNNYKIVAYSILVLGITLRIIVAIISPSFFIDEIWLSLNIKTKSFFDLLHPLDYNQMAPPLFIWITKLFYTLWHKNLVLKIPVLIFSIFSLYIFFLIIRETIEPKLNQLIALLIYSISPYGIYLSLNVKQYSADLLVVLIVVYLYLIKKYHVSKIAYLGIFTIFLSNTTIFIMGAVLLHELFFRNNFDLKEYLKIKVILPFLLFATSAILYYLMFAHENPVRDFMLQYWKLNFFPIEIWESDNWKYYLILIGKLSGTVVLTNKALNLGSALIAILLLISILNIRKDNAALLIFLFVFSIQILFSALKIYPVDTRLMFYLNPLLIIAISQSKVKYNKINSLLLSFLIGFISYINVKSFPFKNNDLTSAYIFSKNQLKENVYFDSVSKGSQLIDNMNFFEIDDIFISRKDFSKLDEGDYVLSFIEGDNKEFHSINAMKNTYNVKIVYNKNNYRIYQIVK